MDLILQVFRPELRDLLVRVLGVMAILSIPYLVGQFIAIMIMPSDDPLKTYYLKMIKSLWKLISRFIIDAIKIIKSLNNPILLLKHFLDEFLVPLIYRKSFFNASPFIIILIPLLNYFSLLFREKLGRLPPKFNSRND